MSAESQQVRDVTDSLINEARAELTSADLPANVVSSYADFANAVQTANGAGDQFASDMADLAEKRVLLPPAGHAHLASAALNDATETSGSAYRDAQRAHASLLDALTTAALPALDSSREALARQEAETALSRADKNTVVNQAVRLAGGASREAAAALLSPWGRTLLESRGVEGGDLERAFSEIRQAAAQAASNHGTTKREKAAAAGLQAARKVESAVGASSSYVALVLRGAGDGR